MNATDQIAELLRDLAMVLPGDAFRQSNHTRAVSALISGTQATMSDAVAKACELIEGSTAPAIAGLNGLTIEAVREAVDLAERQRMKLLPAPLPDPVVARQPVTQTATLGHALACDLRVAFREDDGQRGGPVDQAITARVPNTLFVDGRDLDALLRLRLEARRRGAEVFTRTTGLSVKRVVVTLPADVDPRVAAQWHRVAVQVQEELRVCVLTVATPQAANVRGAVEVITWQTGLSCATGGVDFADGAPRPCAGQASLLRRGAVDLLIDTGATPVAADLAAHVSHRIRIGAEPDKSAAVSFVTPGLAPGLAARVMRFDGVILWLCDDPATAPADPVVELLRSL